jgi:hypothetical protein
LKTVLERFEHTDSLLLGIITDNASPNYLMIRGLHSTLEASGIGWPALRNCIPCMAHVIKIALGAFRSITGVNGRCKTWETHEHDQQVGENGTTAFMKSRTLRKEGNARINNVLAMNPGLAKIIEKERI